MEEQRPGLLVVVSGPSGVGKGTVRNEILRANPNMVLSISATTRPMRVGEQEGRDYFFVSNETFEEMIVENAFLEYICGFDGRSYGTPRKYVQENLDARRDVLLEIDVQGGLKVKQMCPEAVLIFLAPPSMDELKRRLTERGTETPESIEQRTKIAYKEMECVSYYDYVVVNNTIEMAKEGIAAIIHAEKSRVVRSDDLISLLLERRDVL